MNHNLPSQIARFELLVSIASVSISIPIDVRYLVYPAAPAMGLPDEVVHVDSVAAVAVEHKAVVEELLPLDCGLFGVLEWEIFLRLCDMDLDPPRNQQTSFQFHGIPA